MVKEMWFNQPIFVRICCILLLYEMKNEGILSAALALLQKLYLLYRVHRACEGVPERLFIQLLPALQVPYCCVIPTCQYYCSSAERKIILLVKVNPEAVYSILRLLSLGIVAS